MWYDFEMDDVLNSERKSWLYSVTLFSKYLSLTLFILLPFVGFFVGMHYADVKDKNVQTDIVQVASTEPDLIQSVSDSKYIEIASTTIVFQPRIVEEATSTGHYVPGVNYFTKPVNCISKYFYESQKDQNTDVKIATATSTGDGSRTLCSVPEKIIEIGQEYLIQKLGDEYVNQNMTLSLDHVSQSGGLWHLPYVNHNSIDFLRKTGPWIFLHIDEINYEVKGVIPDCIANPILCSKNVSEAQALETARMNHLTASSTKKWNPDIFTYYIDNADLTGPGWAWFLSLRKKSLDGCQSEIRTLEINIGTGSISPITSHGGYTCEE